MKRRKSPAPTVCAHFTGGYVGKCKAGIAYDSVRDQNRRDEMARFPCDSSLNSFTTCDRAYFTPIEGARKRTDLSARNRGRTVIYTPDEAEGGPPARGQLVGCSSDRATTYIRVGKTSRRSRVIAVPSERCRVERRSSGKEGGGGGGRARRARELPLFDLREVPAAPEKGATRRGRRRKAA